VAADPFVVVAAGRCPFTTDSLLAVADLIDRFRARRDGMSPNFQETRAAQLGVFAGVREKEMLYFCQELIHVRHVVHLRDRPARPDRLGNELTVTNQPAN
jgi:hypothetical protein